MFSKQHKCKWIMTELGSGETIPLSMLGFQSIVMQLALRLLRVRKVNRVSDKNIKKMTAAHYTRAFAVTSPRTLWASSLCEDAFPVLLRIMVILMEKLSRISESGSGKRRHPVCAFPHTQCSASPLPLPGKSLLALCNCIYIFNLMGWTGLSSLRS